MMMMSTVLPGFEAPPTGGVSIFESSFQQLYYSLLAPSAGFGPRLALNSIDRQQERHRRCFSGEICSQLA